jgi:DNA-binding NarL/FixJ family response regulator
MKNIRVLVANRPRLMRELVVASISDQPDIEVIGEIEDESTIVRAVEELRPDFLIVALDTHDALPHFCQPILQDHPYIKIIAIAPDRNTTVFYWASLRVQSNPIEPSEDGVLNAIRGIRQSTPRIQ